MIPKRNLDAPDEKDIYMTPENKEYLRDTISKELGPFFYSAIWKGWTEQILIDYLTDSLAIERDIRASECQDTVKRLSAEILKEIEEEGDPCIEAYNKTFPWKIVDKCLNDETFSKADLSGPRNKIIQQVPANLEDPFLKLEMHLMITMIMDRVGTFEKVMIAKKKKGPFNLNKDKLVEYLIMDFRIEGGRFRFTHVHAMSVILPDLVSKLLPMMRKAGLCNTVLA